MLDKTPVAFGGLDRHVEWLSAPKGTPTYKVPLKQQDSYPKFTLQVLATCSTNLLIKRPVKCFVKEDKDKKKDIEGKMARYKARAYKDATKAIEEAKKEGTNEQHIIQDANRRLLKQHGKDLAKNKPNTPKNKRWLTPKKVFKVDKKTFKRTAEKGIDFAQYLYNWLLSDLYPYYYKVKETNLDYNVYLIQDNLGAY